MRDGSARLDSGDEPEVREGAREGPKSAVWCGVRPIELDSGDRIAVRPRDYVVRIWVEDNHFAESHPVRVEVGLSLEKAELLLDELTMVVSAMRAQSWRKS